MDELNYAVHLARGGPFVMIILITEKQKSSARCLDIKTGWHFPNLISGVDQEPCSWIIFSVLEMRQAFFTVHIGVGAGTTAGTVQTQELNVPKNEVSATHILVWLGLQHVFCFVCYIL